MRCSKAMVLLRWIWTVCSIGEMRYPSRRETREVVRWPDDDGGYGGDRAGEVGVDSELFMDYCMAWRLNRMHELSIIQDIFETLESSASQNGIAQITKVKLVVGKLTAAQPSALQFGFEALKEGHPLLSDAVLEIEERDVRARCRKCDSSFALDEGRFSCPECGSYEVELKSGRELFIDFYEGD